MNSSGHDLAMQTMVDFSQFFVRPKVTPNALVPTKGCLTSRREAIRGHYSGEANEVNSSHVTLQRLEKEIILLKQATLAHKGAHRQSRSKSRGRSSDQRVNDRSTSKEARVLASNGGIGLTQQGSPDFPPYLTQGQLIVIREPTGLTGPHGQLRYNRTQSPMLSLIITPPPGLVPA